MSADTDNRKSGGTLNGLTNAVRSNSAFARLGNEAMNYATARAEKMVENVTDRLKESGKGGNLKAAFAGAQGLAQGQSPMRAGMRAAMTGLKEKVKSALGGGKKGGGGQAKVTNIAETIDIGLPVDQVFNHWTQFEEFAKFMKGVEGVERTSDTETNWRVKVAKSRRTWKGTVQEMIPDRRIVWTSEGGKGSTKGVVTFHPLADDLTRVLLVMEYYPSGFFEKTGNIWRAGGRRARLDLKHFRRHTMMWQDEPPEGWRVEIRDSQVVGEAEEEGAGEEAPEESQQRQEQGRGGQNGRADGRDARADEDRDRERDEDQDAEAYGEPDEAAQPEADTYEEDEEPADEDTYQEEDDEEEPEEGDRAGAGRRGGRTRSTAAGRRGSR